jgi:sugar phosphate isomerase/epimerase
MPPTFNRRSLLAGAGAAAVSALAAGRLVTRADEPASAYTTSATQDRAAPEIGYCLNTSTLRGHKLSLAEEIDIAAEAGYDAIEPWIREIRQYLEQGGTTAELKKRIDDVGLAVPSAIGFAEWIVDDDSARARGLETAKSDMELLFEIGGTRIAAPPAGATGQSDLNLLRAAERYRALLELGDKTGVVPQVEVWGFSKSLSRLGEVLLVAAESGHPKACLLPDVYHIYKGGSDFGGLRLIDGGAIHVFHINDYPADPPRETIRDADRVYPGDGVAPIGEILRTVYDAGFRGMLSLELFNEEYWKQPPLDVARTGLEKMRTPVASALLVAIR